MSIRSDVLSVAEITAMLGLVPDDSGDIGELTPSGIAGRPVRPDLLRYQRTHWSLSKSDEGYGEDTTGFASLKALVSEFAHCALELERIRENGETRIWWSGSSDSSQGGFVLPAPLIRGISELGCDLWGTAYLGQDSDEDD